MDGQVCEEGLHSLMVNHEAEDKGRVGCVDSDGGMVVSNYVSRAAIRELTSMPKPPGRSGQIKSENVVNEYTPESQNHANTCN